jgi:hypothetical protein
MILLIKKTSFFIFYFLTFFLITSISYAAFNNQIINLDDCNNDEMGKSNSVVNIDENEIFFEMEDDGILGYLPIAKKTQTGIFSQVVSIEKYASTDLMEPVTEEEEIIQIVSKYIDISVNIFPKVKNLSLKLLLNKPNDYTHRRIVEDFARDELINFNEEEIYNYKCKDVKIYSSVSENNTDKKENEYFGIGIRFTTKDKEYPVVESVIKNSPADKAGLAKGDKLWDIDGVDLFNKSSDYVASLIKNSKSTFVMLYYFDKSEGFSKRVSIRPGLIVDPEEEQRKKDEDERRQLEEEKKQKEEAEREQLEEEKRRKEERDRQKKEKEKDEQIKILEQEIDDLKIENSELNNTITDLEEANVLDNETLLHENKIYKVFINVIFSIIAVIIILYALISMLNDKFIGIKIHFSKRQIQYNNNDNTKVINNGNTETNNDTIKEKFVIDDTNNQPLEKESIKETINDSDQENTKQNEVNTAPQSNNGFEEEQEEIDDQINEQDESQAIVKKEINEDKSTIEVQSGDSEYLDFINQYYSSLQNPNSVAMLEKKYKIIPLERQSPITLESSVMMIKSSQSIIKANFWLCKLSNDKNILLPGRSLISRSNELIKDNGRFGIKIFNGIYQIKMSESFKILEPSYCEVKGNEFVIVEIGNLTIDQR